MKNDIKEFNAEKFVQNVLRHSRNEHGYNYTSILLALEYLTTRPKIISVFKKENKNIEGIRQILKTRIEAEHEERENDIKDRASGSHYDDDRIEAIVKNSLASDDIEEVTKTQSKNEAKNLEREK